VRERRLGLGREAWARLALIAGAVALLEALCQTHIINPLTLIAPSEMAAALWEMLAAGRLTADIETTFMSVGAAFALAVGFGFAAGAALHALPRLRRSVDPLLASYYAIPFFVFYPLLIAIFGLNRWPLIVIGFVFATAAMMIATLNGLDRVPRVLLKVARVHRLGRLEAIFQIILPAAAPHLFTGLKLALAYAFIGVLAGEFILSGGGLGYGIAYAYDSFDNRTMYALMLFVLVLVTLMNTGLHLWEQRLLRRRVRQ
jgi:NitT/TauT family transport system permease protein